MLSKDREAHADSLGRIYQGILSIDIELTLTAEEVKSLARKVVEDEITRSKNLG